MDGSWKEGGWIIVAGAFTINFLGDGIIYSFGVLLVEFLNTFHQSRAATALIGSIMHGFTYLIGPVAGPICDGGGSRGVAMVGSVLSAVGVLASYYATSVAMLYVTFGVVGGTGIGLMISAANACVMKHFTTTRALASGIAVCGSGAGTFVMTQLIAYLIDLYAWRGAVLIVSGLLLNGLVCSLLLTVSRQLTRNRKIDIPPQSGVEQQFDRQVYKYSKALKTMFDFTLLRDIRCASFILSSFFVDMAFSIPFIFLPDQASDYGIPDYKASWLVSSIGIANTISRVLLGLLADRKFVNRLYLLESFMILSGISMALSPLLTTFETKLVFTFSYGFCTGGYVMLVPVVLTDLFGADSIGKAFGFYAFAVGMAGLVAPPIVGWMFDRSGSYTLAFLLAGGEFIMASVILVLPSLRNRCLQSVYTINS